MEDSLIGWYDAEVLEDSGELLVSYMAALGLVEILERGLQENTIGNDDFSHFGEGVKHHLLFLVRKILKLVLNMKIFFTAVDLELPIISLLLVPSSKTESMFWQKLA